MRPSNRRLARGRQPRITASHMEGATWTHAAACSPTSKPPCCCSWQRGERAHSINHRGRHTTNSGPSSRQLNREAASCTAPSRVRNGGSAGGASSGARGYSAGRVSGGVSGKRRRRGSATDAAASGARAEGRVGGGGGEGSAANGCGGLGAVGTAAAHDADGNGGPDSGGVSSFVSTLHPGTRGPTTDCPPPRSPNVLLERNGSVSVGHSASCEDTTQAGIGKGSGGLSCHPCGEHFSKWEALEAHHLSKHAACGTVETYPVIHDHYDCLRYGRLDLGFVRWWWRPAGCELPHLDPAWFLRAARGRFMAFVGDSLAKNQMHSLGRNLDKPDAGWAARAGEFDSAGSWFFHPSVFHELSFF
uniref:C2H2-type domain-containing protein n=1 Tax=Setaria viridis TaxID=4556 RepID=A0A4U6SXU0_SETVI|nr:hypothetical protein SEVIR_9G255600v2 [Setaria viridis]